MENREYISQLQKDRRDLIAGIQERREALKGLEAYLKYLGVTDDGHAPEPSQPEPRISVSAHLKPTARAYGGGESVATNGKPGELVLSREVQKGVLGIGIGHEFTQRDITDRIAGDYPDQTVRSASVYNALMRMARRGEIEKVRDGGGSEPTVFRRVIPQDGFLPEVHDDEDGAVDD